MLLKNIEEKKLKEVEKKYKFENKYFEDPQKLKDSIINKTVIPHQVEFQPGPLGKKICWLSCPYCYDFSSKEDKTRFAQRQKQIELAESKGLKHMGQSARK